jgi:hypothetical protein
MDVEKTHSASADLTDPPEPSRPPQYLGNVANPANPPPWAQELLENLRRNTLADRQARSLADNLNRNVLTDVRTN